MSMFCSSSHLVITFALWQGALSCWKRRVFVAKLFLDCREKYSQRTLLCHSQKSLATAVELTMFLKALSVYFASGCVNTSNLTS